MKRVYLTALFLVLISGTGFGESLFGLKVIISDAYFYGSDWDLFSESYNSENLISPGISAGFFSEIPVNEMFSVQPEILLFSSSYKYGQKESWFMESWPLLEITLYGKFRLSVPTGRLYFASGPELMLFRDLITLTDDSGSEFFAVPYNDILYGISFAAGIERPGPSGTFLIGAKYYLGLNSYSRDSAIYSSFAGIEIGWKTEYNIKGTKRTKKSRIR